MDRPVTTTEIEFPPARLFPAFPYQPYEIQQQFMNTLYDTLETGGVGILESPTGTGKTLSIICSALQWLHDKNKALDNGEDASPSNMEVPVVSNEPDWLKDFDNQDDLRKRKERKLRREKRRLRAQQDSAAFNKKTLETLGGCRGAEASKNTKPSTILASSSADDAEFMLEDWESDKEGASTQRKRAAEADCSDEGDGSDASSSSDSSNTDIQIIFCSRTHSQLSQFVGEVKRTPFAKDIRMVALGGRKQLCVHPVVRSLASAAQMNERCLEMQKSTSKLQQKTSKVDARATAKSINKTGGCPFKRTGPMHKLKEAILAELMDIEDVGKQALRRECCGYYSARRAQCQADLVLMPYNSLVHREAREALGVRVKGNVVIVDEAHNLIDSIAQAHSVPVSGSQIEAAADSLTAYLQRFRSRLSPGNRRHLETMLMLARNFLRQIHGDRPVCSQETLYATSSGRMLGLNDFLFQAGVDNINLMRLQRYMKESKVLFKVSSYSDSCLVSEESSNRLGALHMFAGLVGSLGSSDQDGRVLVVRGSDLKESCVKFLLLDASSRFAEVVSQARAVVLAGGTLQPTRELAVQLFPQALQSGRVRTLSCPHIVPPENLLALCVSTGPSGKRLLLNHKARQEEATIDELGQLLINVCRATPDGIVVFFPSFDYENTVHKRWSLTGVLATLGAIKAVFREPRAAVDVERTLQEYAEAIANPDKGQSSGTGTTTSRARPLTGAVILCVVGGKLSEGINFSDRLGRCVMMFGLPYANPTDPELVEKMRYLSAGIPKDDITIATSPDQFQQRGQEYYENLCMRAVNQSIGRAIRHRNDYAVILLIDERWSREQQKGFPEPPVERLPGWIRKSVEFAPSFGTAYSKVHQFYRGKR